MGKLPRYPIYIPSKGRATRQASLTARFLLEDRVPFSIVIEEPERDAYARLFGEDCLLILPFRDQGLIAARNWIKEHATRAGYERHWQLDDNIRGIWRVYKGERLRAAAGPVLAAAEDFVDRYENVAVAGLNYVMFGCMVSKPFALNHHVYSCSLILNSLPYKWRARYNDDTDFCLQVLAGGWCTILFNAFLIQKLPTMRLAGGNTTDLYQGQGRLRMARSLERQWPGVVRTIRRFRRPQHYVAHDWRRFDTPLKRKSNVKVDEAPNEYGMELQQVAPIRSAELQDFVRRARRNSSRRREGATI